MATPSAIGERLFAAQGTVKTYVKTGHLACPPSDTSAARLAAWEDAADEYAALVTTWWGGGYAATGSAAAH